MLERDREIPSTDVAVNQILNRPSASGRRARGTAPPAQTTVEDATTVECKKCKARVAFANAHVLPSHCVCEPCALADARAAALSSAPKNAESTKLPHQIGAPLLMMLLAVVGTGVLILIYQL